MTIERALQKQAGIKSASVNFASESALIEFDENLISEKDLAKAVKDIGYELMIENKSPIIAGETREFQQSVNLETVSLKVLGMDSAHCAMMVEQAIGKLAGIDKIDADFPNQRAKIVFDASKISLEEIFKVIIDIGYKPIKEIGGTQDILDKEKFEQEKQLGILRKKTLGWNNAFNINFCRQLSFFIQVHSGNSHKHTFQLLGFIYFNYPGPVLGGLAILQRTQITF